jgi:hypothetical protein
MREYETPWSFETSRTTVATQYNIPEDHFSATPLWEPEASHITYLNMLFIVSFDFRRNTRKHDLPIEHTFYAPYTKDAHRLLCGGVSFVLPFHFGTQQIHVVHVQLVLTFWSPVVTICTTFLHHYETLCFVTLNGDVGGSHTVSGTILLSVPARLWTWNDCMKLTSQINIKTNEKMVQTCRNTHACVRS